MSTDDGFGRLVEIMHTLRIKCPWDHSQDHQTLRPYLLEETYEVLHTLDSEDYDDLCEELGDLLLQVVFHAEVARESERFDIGDVVRGICAKLVRRHPHVFGDKQADTPDEVRSCWEKIKRAENKNDSPLDSIPTALPALLKATRMLDKMRQTGLDPFRGRNSIEDARHWLDELADASNQKDNPRAALLTGLVMIALTDAVRPIRVDPESALRERLNALEEAFRDEDAQLRREGLDKPDTEQASARLFEHMSGEV